MNALVMNCSPVRTGATAQIVKIVSDCLSEKYDVRSICSDCIGCAILLGRYSRTNESIH